MIQVGRERLVRLVLVGLARRRPGEPGLVERQQLPAVLGDPERRPEQRLGRGGAQADDELGLDHARARRPATAGRRDVLGPGRLVQPPLARSG